MRHHLDTNQPGREGMCLALLPLLGPYTREQPRRPKGGPDGGRDMEAILPEGVVIWGGVGFRNGGGNDEAARKEAETKFRDDLERMLKEAPAPAGFVFFTNVDLTPAQKLALTQHARDRGMVHVEVFDFERLRNVLDSAEGLIARLQYLGIPMSATEQAALAAKYGADIQRAVATRFDRVERTLGDMEDFLAFHRPLFRVDLYVELRDQIASLADEAFVCAITGLRDVNETISFMSIYNSTEHGNLVARVSSWFPGPIFGESTDDSQHHGFIGHPTASYPVPTTRLASSAYLTLQRMGNLARLIDLVILRMEALCTEELFARVVRVMVDANGYELFSCAPSDGAPMAVPPIPPDAGYDASSKNWRSLVRLEHRMILTSPMRRSPRFLRD